MLHHGDILKKILIDKKISQKQFSKLMGYSEKNFSTNFYKEKLDDDIIEKITDIINNSEPQKPPPRKDDDNRPTHNNDPEGDRPPHDKPEGDRPPPRN